MKPTHSTVSTALLAAFAFSAATTVLPAQTPGAGATMNLEIATPQSEAFALRNLAGKPLRGSNQEQFSTIEDFLIDPQTGQLHFAVSPSGSGPSGETFRIIPMTALTASPNGDVFTVHLDRSKWDQVGTLIESRLKNRVSVDRDHLERLARQFGTPSQAQGDQNLVRASELKGRELRSGSEQIGTIEDVVIDLNNRRAAPLLKPSAGFSSAGQKFLVPFAQLQIGEQAQGAITTTLSRADFQRVQPGMSPTGQTSAMFSQGQPIGSAVSAVQQALSRDQSLSGVQVIPERRIVLRGTVENQQKKSEVERMAQQAAPGVRIDSEITVRNW